MYNKKTSGRENSYWFLLEIVGIRIQLDCSFFVVVVVAVEFQFVCMLCFY